MSAMMNPFTRIQIRNHLIERVPGLSRVLLWRRGWMALRDWSRDGWASPPPHFVRLAMIESEARAIGAECFIETGTFRGDTTWHFRNRFRRIASIEIQHELAALARRRFKAYPHICIIAGDSSTELATACSDMDGACLVFLDGHYSSGFTGCGAKECPVIEELQLLFTHLKHAFRVVIDDARLFGVDPSYPKPDVIEEFLAGQPGNWRMRSENDAYVIWRA